MIEIVPTLGRWPRAPLGELCDIRGGFPAPQDDAAFEEGEIPFVRMKDVGRHHFTNNLCETDQSLNRAHFDEGRYQLTPRGSILMPRSGSVGLNHRAILTIDAVVVSHLCALVPTSDKVTTDFLYRFLCLADMRKLTKKTTGLDSIAFSDLRMVAIPLPPLAEQRRIAEVLDRAEALRAKRRAALAELDSLTQSLFLDLFGDPVWNEKGWPCHSLSEVAVFENGDRSSNYPSGDDIQTEGVLFLSTKNIVEDRLNLSSAVFITPEKFRSLSRGKAQRMDLIITLRGTLGSCCIFDCPHDTAFINAQMMIVRSRENVTPKFLHALLTSKQAQDRFARIGHGAAVPQLTATQLSKLPIPVPPIPLQREFARRVTAVEALKTAQRASLAELDALFATLQHRAFRGEL